MSLLSGFNVTFPEVELLGEAAIAAFAGGAIPVGWNVVTPQQLGVPSQYWDGNYFTNNGASAIVLQQGSTWIVSFRGTDGSNDVLQYPELVFGTYINHFQPLLSAVASNAPAGTSFDFTGASLGGGATNQMADIAGSQYGGKFAAAHFVAFASPDISTANGILNIGFENDPIYKAIAGYRDFSSSLDNLVLATSQYMQGNYDGLHPPDDYAHNAALAFDAFTRLQTSAFFDQMSPDSVVIFDEFSGTVQDTTPGRENTGAFYLGSNAVDVIIGRNGDDHIEGFAGNDTLLGGAGNEILLGGAGNDVLNGGSGNDYIDGGPGIDIATFSGVRSQYTVDRLAPSEYQVVGPDGTDTVANVEILQFSDTTLPLDVDLTTPALTTYQKMYGVAPSSAELSVLVQFNSAQFAYGVQIQTQDPIVYVYSALGQALAEASDTGSTAFKSTWGPIAIPSDATFAVQAYANVFGVAGLPAQIQHFVDQLNFYESIYTASGAFGTDANRIDLLARGAIFGQMLGVKAEIPAAVATAVTDTSLVGVSGQHDGLLGLI